MIEIRRVDWGYIPGLGVKLLLMIDSKDIVEMIPDEELQKVRVEGFTVDEIRKKLNEQQYPLTIDFRIPEKELKR